VELDPAAAEDGCVLPIGAEPMLAFISMYEPRLDPVALDDPVEPDVPVADEPLPP